MVSQSILIKTPIQTIYHCVVDFEAYPKFLSEIKSVRIEWCDDKEMEVTFKIQLIKEITYTLHVELDPSRAVYWKLKQGELMKKNTGSWKFKMKDDNLTEATYSIDVEFGLWVPKAITQTLIEKSLPQTLQRFKKRSEKLLKSK
ncbi:MAG: hypothetical protein A3F82_07105 [Deltaproteobacteria bacterium RIFCSPLOWO2_12_FULL_44_12]|nr:MAG: hypothetical protein A2712_09940 [Deltaproteobacteria bacterium RIFCSPHIGHO2_01_FULL_43_49]OGQ15432.1 MAG: hypothetical protein A3D22_10470 [Deltaproteobacteria bacterium RIFCSPHIGHO2_02_FULL_44_53]OGQ29625.1 MAG: hypothetical protein A3D98_10670 [Deltaproteobacteria bacterium RIFCSPHIGHO2_12_FULL_44_21]OGQ32238.1 MAG: hypothetical protein A2979_00315 [Deltaproteobacteria bacterium RIFCSPLOWO2_01_FULL_45_74]OGQ43880.1 MAG: hypothetical protein A3I70_04210 [Deltaproteobacteria bacterium 